MNGCRHRKKYIIPGTCQTGKGTKVPAPALYVSPPNEVLKGAAQTFVCFFASKTGMKLSLANGQVSCLH